MLVSFVIRGVSLTHPVLASFLSGEFLLHIVWWFQFSLGSFSCTSCAGFNFIRALSLTHAICWLYFYQGSFSYTSRACFIFTQPMPASFFVEGVSLTHPNLPLFLCGELPSFLCGEFLLHIPCWFLFMRIVFLTHPDLTSFLCLTHTKKESHET